MIPTHSPAWGASVEAVGYFRRGCEMIRPCMQVPNHKTPMVIGNSVELAIQVERLEDFMWCRIDAEGRRLDLVVDADNIYIGYNQ
jgi:hypothetical protein